MVDNHVVHAARQRRIALYGAMMDLDASLASPSGRLTWATNVRRNLAQVQQALINHVEEVEGPDGIMARITIEAPRLSDRVDALRNEHPELLERAAAVAARLEALEQSPDEDEADEVRDAALGLLGALARHRHRGADLVYDAFDIEIGGG
jgi:hypothetical protein